MRLYVEDGLHDDGEVGVLERREPAHRVLLQRGQEPVVVIFRKSGSFVVAVFQDKDQRGAPSASHDRDGTSAGLPPPSTPRRCRSGSLIPPAKTTVFVRQNAGEADEGRTRMRYSSALRDEVLEPDARRGSRTHGLDRGEVSTIRELRR